MQTDVTTDQGSVAIPAECNIPATTATKAEDLQEIYTSTEPWGYTYKITTDLYYTPGVGLVCGITDQIENNYDTETTGRLDMTNEWKDVEALTQTSLQSALRKTNSMQAATASATAGLQAGLTRVREERLMRQRAARLAHRVNLLRKAHPVR